MKKTPVKRPPDCLSTKSKGIWKAVVNQFELEAEALQTLQVALENLDLADTARNLLRVDGLVVNGKKHPASDSVKLHDGLYLRALRQLGLDVIAPGLLGRPPGR
jgi:hypothetical protein